MKVLETTPNATFTMGKKKHKLRNTKQSTPQDVDQSESSDDATPVAGASGQTCPHINKAVNLAAMRKAVQKQIFGECTSCAKEAFSGKKGDKPAAADVTAETEAGPLRSSTDDLFVEDSEPIIWVCLQCGHQGCDRNSDNKHSLRHHETPHSSCHSIVINTTSWAAWCYTCDDEVFIEGSKRLKEALEFLRKTAGVCSDVPAQPGRRGQVGGAGDDGQLNGRSRPSLGRTGSGQSPALCQKVKGLSNLGNTCFFNAVMQVLCQTPSLEALVGERGKKGCVLPLPGRSPDPDSDHSHSSTASSSEEELQDMDGDKNLGPIEVVLPDVGSLTQAVLNFLHEMNNTSGKSGTVTPNLLFGQVCKKAPRFRGYQQQDSHELLRYLLDNMKTEEIKRGRTGILKYFKLSENANPKKIDGCTRMKVKEYGRQAKCTFVDRVFGGQLISTVVCGECGYASQIYEPFLDLSLSITEEKPHRPNFASSVKKQANLESTVSAPKLNKQQQRKQKKQAKRDEKRKQKTAKNKVVPLSEFQSGSDGATPVSESGEVNSETAGDLEKTTVREADGSQDSDLEDTSDADVEDNVETDSLRNTAATITPTEDYGSGVIRSDVLAINGLVGGASGLENRVETVSERLSSLEIGGENAANGSSNEHLSHFPVGQQTTCISGACSTISLLSTGSQCESSEVSGTPSPRPPHNGVTNNLTSDPAPGLSNGDLSLPRGHQEKSREQLKKEVRLRSMVTLGPRYQPLPRECSVLSSLHHFTSAELLAGNNKFGCRKCTKSQKEQTGKSEMMYTNASKHYLIFSPPAVLTLHFKRFEQIGFTSRKVNSHVDFPFLLDVSPFCSSLCQGRRRDQKQIVYSLYGVVEHSGRISGGHYTAYVKVRPNVGLVMDFLRAFAAHPRELVQQYTESFVAGRMDGRTDRSEDTSDASDVPIPPGRWYHISDSRVSEVQETSVQTAQAYMLFYERVC